ncbi:MAG TPA: hypothetical protein VHN80_14440, partial [Kineosporiaceae bacterium]|nr:hypothetical protein [Kineosporiaceae bacterium]
MDSASAGTLEEADGSVEGVAGVGAAASSEAHAAEVSVRPQATTARRSVFMVPFYLLIGAT